MTAPTGGSFPLSGALAIDDLNQDGLPDAAVTQCAPMGCVHGGFVAVLLHVGDTATTTTLSSSSNPSPYGKPITLTAEVQSTSGVPTGAVKFFDGSTELASGTLVGGTSSINISTIKAGLRNITAVYQGSDGFSRAHQLFSNRRFSRQARLQDSVRRTIRHLFVKSLFTQQRFPADSAGQ